MKKILGLLLGGTLLLNSLVADAQTYAESALLYSRLSPAGSARIQSLGGAQVSLGGDYSSALSNPAGLGMFNRSEFSISPGMNFNSTSSNYLGNNTAGSKSTFQIPGISLVFHKDQNTDNEGSTFLGGSFGFSYSRTNDFNKSFSYQGTNSTNSIIDYFVQDAYGTNTSQFDPGSNSSDPGYNYNYPTGLAYDSYLINPDSTGTNYGSPLDPLKNETRTVLQREDVKISGSQNQATFAYGANLADRVFLGAGIGIAHINYQSTKNFRESNYTFSTDPTFNPLNSLLLSENLKSNGYGFNASLGIIARPVDFIQIGFSYISPNIYSMNDTYSAFMNTNWNNFDVGAFYGNTSNVLNGPSPLQADPILSSYNLRTPSRINFGTTLFVKKSGFITGDIEMVNYPGAKYSSTGLDQTDYSADNNQIKTSVQSTLNYRAGAEYRYKNYRVRGGYSFMPTPYRSTQYGYGINQQLTTLTGGVGYKAKTFYIDIAYIYRQGSNGYRPYSTVDYNTLANNSPLVNTSTKSSLVMVTVGFPFTR